MRRFGSIAVVLVFSTLAAAPAAHAERFALLIGNQSYTSEIGKLANPHNDIALLEKALKDLRFEVTSVRDAGLAALHQAVNAYARRLRAAGPNAVGFFYYAGHGAADAGTNYLIPVDVKSAEEGELWDVSLRLTEITRKLKAEAGNATHFVVFDACRNNLKLLKAGSRALVQSRGFVPVAQESGMLIAYATAEGELASDMGAGAGPYAKVLAQEIVKPGVEAVTMFRNVQRRVRADIKQEPYLGFSALGDVYLAGLDPDPPKSAAAPTLPAPAVSSAQPSEAERAWGATKDSASIPALEAFIRRFGDTYYGDLAKVRLAELKQAEATKQLAEAATKADEDSRTKAEAERQRLAMLQQEQERKRVEAEAAKQRQDEEARAKADAERQPLSQSAHIREAQERLYELNYDPGPADGRLTQQTEQAIREFETALGSKATGRLTAGLLHRLKSAGGLAPWGAIVFSDATQKWGMSWSHDTRKAAVAAAQASCGSNPSACSKALTFFATGCGAFAHSATRWSLIARDTSARARLAALEECQKQGARCSIVASVCAGGQDRAQ